MAKKQTTQIDNSEFERTERIKRLVVIAMFSDDELLHRFVLKGGNALDLVLKIGTRASIDIDLSMENDFKPEELNGIRQRLEDNLQPLLPPKDTALLMSPSPKSPR